MYGCHTSKCDSHHWGGTRDTIWNACSFCEWHHQPSESKTNSYLMACYCWPCAAGLAAVVLTLRPVKLMLSLLWTWIAFIKHRHGCCCLWPRPVTRTQQWLAAVATSWWPSSAASVVCHGCWHVTMPRAACMVCTVRLSHWPMSGLGAALQVCMHRRS